MIHNRDEQFAMHGIDGERGHLFAILARQCGQRNASATLEMAHIDGPFVRADADKVNVVGGPIDGQILRMLNVADGAQCLRDQIQHENRIFIFNAEIK